MFFCAKRFLRWRGEWNWCFRPCVRASVRACVREDNNCFLRRVYEPTTHADTHWQFEIMILAVFKKKPSKSQVKDKNQTVHENQFFFAKKIMILQELRYLRAHWELGVHIWGPYWIYILLLENKLFFSRPHFFFRLRPSQNRPKFKYLTKSW